MATAGFLVGGPFMGSPFATDGIKSTGCDLGAGGGGSRIGAGSPAAEAIEDDAWKGGRPVGSAGIAMANSALSTMISLSA